MPNDIKDFGQASIQTLRKLYNDHCLVISNIKLEKDHPISKTEMKAISDVLRQRRHGFLVLNNAMVTYLKEYPLVADSKAVTKALARANTGIKGNHVYAQTIIDLYTTIEKDFDTKQAIEKQQIIESAISKIKKDVYAVLVKNETAHGVVGTAIKEFFNFYYEPELANPIEGCEILNNHANQYMLDNPPLGSFSMFAYLGAKDNYKYAKRIHDSIRTHGFNDAKDSAAKDAAIKKILPQVGQVYLDMLAANITNGQVIRMIQNFYQACRTLLPEPPKPAASMFSSLSKACGM